MEISLVNLYVNTHYCGLKGVKKLLAGEVWRISPEENECYWRGSRPVARCRRFTATTTILFVFPFIFKFCNPSEV